MQITWLSAWKQQLVCGGRNRMRTGRSFGEAPQSSETLEFRCLLSATAGPELVDGDLDEDHGVDADGNEWHALPEAAYDATTIGGGTNTGGSSPFAYSETFLLHSNPGASHTIYLDFDGHTTSGTAWNSNFNGGSNFTTPAYNPDGISGFSNSELTSIQKVWQRVTEDFAPFDVDVTTEEPANVADLIKSGTGDTNWGVRVVIGGSSYDWYGNGAGGVAYLGSFNWNTDTPTYVFPDQLGNGYEKYVAEAASHEAGHTLGLHHDGTPTSGYYSGHGSGETGWAPIMGVGYYQNLTQWSRGEYSQANQLEDDLAIITSQNGFGYRADDYGDSDGTASAANLVNSTTIDAAGIIETTADVDVFSFTTGAGTVSIDVQEFEIGANLDILAELYDSSGSLVTSANPADFLDAQLSANVSAGTYFLHVSGVGKGDPQGTGYSDYGSLGQYSFVGTIVDPGGLPGLTINNASTTEGGVLSFTVTLAQAAGDTVTVDFSTANGSATAGSDYSTTSGTLTFLAGETSKTVTVNSLQDAVYEGTEAFVVNLSGASGAVIADGQGTGTIIDDDPAPLPTVSIGDASAVEGKLNTKGKNAGTPQRTSMTFTVTLSAASAQSVTVDYATADDSATLADNDYEAASGTVTFSPGQTSKTITVTIVGDNNIEPDEDFTVNLTNVSGASIDSASGTGTIVNDDSSGGGGGGGGKGGGPKKGSRGAVVDFGGQSQSNASSTVANLQSGQTIGHDQQHRNEEQFVVSDVLDALIVDSDLDESSSSDETSPSVDSRTNADHADEAFADSEGIFVGLASI